VALDAGSVAEQLRAREPIFHRPEYGTTRAAFEAMTVAEYWEVGASGAVYDRRTLLDELERRFADPSYDPMDGLELTDFAVREAGPDVWLATYALRRATGTRGVSRSGDGPAATGSSSITRAR